MDHAEIETFDVLGVRVSALSLHRAVDVIIRKIRSSQRGYVCVSGVHGIMESHRFPDLKAIHNAAFLVTPDGMPLTWVGRLTGKEVSRVYGPDLMLALCEATRTTDISHFFYGGGVGVPELLASRLSSRFPGLKISGMYSPPFGPRTQAEGEKEVARINASNPHIVWVGLSTPKQERWMSEHIGRLNASVLIGVGAAFDFHAGLKPQAPRWMQRSGFEWLFRLSTEPRRLWKRYLTNNPLFIWHILLQLTGISRYSHGVR